MIELWHLPLLFAVGLAAGFVDSIAGGGGLIALPTLLGLGLDPQTALGTSKLQGTFGSGSAAWHYARAGVVDWKDCQRVFVLTLIGAVAGTLVVLKVHPDFLRRVIPLLLAVVALYVFFKPTLGEKDIHPRLSCHVFDLVFGLAFGFYDGFFGPGVGTFWTMAFMLGLGFNMTRATGYTKFANFASNLGSLAFFLLAGRVLVPAGLAMGAGQLLGARFGSRMVVRRGTKFIRPIFLTMVLTITAKLLYDGWLK